MEMKIVHQGEAVGGPDRFRELYPMVLTVVDEIQPLVQLQADQRELLAMASMQLGVLLRTKPNLNRRELRRELEQYLVSVFAIEPNPHGSAEVHGDEHLDVRGSNVLIVDDSAMARRQIQYFLHRAGYNVFQAKSGEEALWLVGEVEPDLVLMDVSMDGISGLEACRRLKADTDNADLPIIFLSAKGEREEVIRGFESGGIDYIVKPFHPAESLTRIHTHLRVRKLARQRQQDILQLRQVNETKDRVLRMASHDLRNPVGAIAGLASFLREGRESSSLTPNQLEIIQSIEEAGKGVVALLNELLDVANFNAGQVELKLESIDPADLLQRICLLFKGEAERKSIRLDWSGDVAGRPIHADRQQLRRVIDNLVSNALKFTPIGGRVGLRAGFDGDGCFWLHVDDNGPGVPECEQSQLFKEFGRTSAVPTGGEKSIGLGLSICARILSAHGGNICFENLPEGGASFRIKLPAA